MGAVKFQSYGQTISLTSVEDTENGHPASVYMNAALTDLVSLPRTIQDGAVLYLARGSKILNITVVGGPTYHERVLVQPALQTVDIPAGQTTAAPQSVNGNLASIAEIDPVQPGLLASDGFGWALKTYNALKTRLGVSKTDVGLDNVDNTSDVAKWTAAATLKNKAISGDDNTVSAIPQDAVTGLVSDLGGRVPLSLVTTRGDLFVGTSPGVAVALPAGSDGDVLQVNLSADRGLAWGGLGSPRPRDHGLLGWSHGPYSDESAQTVPSGTLLLRRIRMEQTGSATKLYIVIAGSSSPVPTANQCFLALYDSSRGRLAATTAGAIDSSLSATPPFILTGTIASTPVTAGTEYFVGFLWNGTGTIQVQRGNGAGLVNLGRTGNGLGCATADTSATTTPSTAASLSASAGSVWAGVGGLGGPPSAGLGFGLSPFGTSSFGS